MEAVLDENGLLEYVQTNIAKPESVDAQNLTLWKKDVAKGEENYIGGSPRLHCLKYTWERNPFRNVEGTEKST